MNAVTNFREINKALQSIEDEDLMDLAHEIFKERLKHEETFNSKNLLEMLFKPALENFLKNKNE